MAFCDDGKYIWTLRGDHTTRVLVKDQLIRTSDIDERVAAYFADREETIELPEKKVLEWSAESDSPSALIHLFLVRPDFYQTCYLELGSGYTFLSLLVSIFLDRHTAVNEPRFLSAQIIHKIFFWTL